MGLIVTRKATGEVVGEFYSRKAVEGLDRAKFRIETAGDYLARINAEIAARNAAEAK